MGRKTKDLAKWRGEWEPTAAMRNFVRAWRENVGATITKLLETTGLSTTWYYDTFQNDPQAQEWFKQERENLFNGPRLQEVHEQLYARAIAAGESNQHQFMKMYMQRFDPEFVERKETKQTIDVRLQHGIPVEERMALLQEAFARARGLPAAKEEIEGEVVTESLTPTGGPTHG